MLTHTYTQKPMRKIKVTICNYQADSPLYVWPDVWSSDLLVYKKYGHTWHGISLPRPDVIEQHKPNLVFQGLQKVINDWKMCSTMLRQAYRRATLLKPALSQTNVEIKEIGRKKWTHRKVCRARVYVWLVNTKKINVSPATKLVLVSNKQHEIYSRSTSIQTI